MVLNYRLLYNVFFLQMTVFYFGLSSFYYDDSDIGDHEKRIIAKAEQEEEASFKDTLA